ncbi:hypothetical protein [Liquorilactobacillus mali]|uniref:Uncharacterized protein n=1 Tax=Liquorilactobacillus mali KCTC 3596 = DSM 20444 TaxID=1046596 RepID=A0A0R2DZM2_9LACO|nr:hypothetical protein [Liquorilactobacillus mali]KRN09369.1 hypothetical protein FD00_GL001092 [Liquorilactobacillus mali KCTC 3596 = DSM 20444]
MRNQILDWYFSDDKSILSYIHSDNADEEVVNELYMSFERRYRLSDIINELPQDIISKEDTYPQWVVSAVNDNVMEKIWYQDDYNEIIEETKESKDYKKGYDSLVNLFKEELNENEYSAENIGYPKKINSIQEYEKEHPYCFMTIVAPQKRSR